MQKPFDISEKKYKHYMTRYNALQIRLNPY